MAKYSTSQVIYKVLFKTAIKFHVVTSKSEILKLIASAD